MVRLHAPEDLELERGSYHPEAPADAAPLARPGPLSRSSREIDRSSQRDAATSRDRAARRHDARRAGSGRRRRLPSVSGTGPSGPTHRTEEQPCHDPRAHPGGGRVGHRTRVPPRRPGPARPGRLRAHHLRPQRGERRLGAGHRRARRLRPRPRLRRHRASSPPACGSSPRATPSARPRSRSYGAFWVSFWWLTGHSGLDKSPPATPARASVSTCWSGASSPLT